MIFQPFAKVYLDESKVRSFYMVATVSTSGASNRSEKALRALLKPGQRRIHFNNERDSRRREILAVICTLDLHVAVWVAKNYPQKVARDLCLTHITVEACQSKISQIIIEQDDSLMVADRRVIANVMREQSHSELSYVHAAPHEYPLLWVSDAVAWCFSAGGDWKRRVEQLVEDRIFVL